MNLSSLTMAADRMEKQYAGAVIKMALDIDRRIVNMTPVDTGRAKINWIVSVGVADTRQFPAPSSAGMADKVATSQAESVLARNRIPDKIIIQNNLPYIQRLNDGWSLQAPPAYIQAEIQSVAERNR